jgi:uncharacterized protein (DUF2147 family)
MAFSPFSPEIPSSTGRLAVGGAMMGRARSLFRAGMPLSRGGLDGKVGPRGRGWARAATLFGALMLAGCNSAPQPNVSLWVDNGNSTVLRIEMDGKTLCGLTPGARSSVQVLPGTHHFRAIAPDGSVLGDLQKSLNEYGRYVYNPGGKKAYAIETRTYEVGATQYMRMPDVKPLGTPEWIDAHGIDYVFAPFPDQVEIKYDPQDVKHQVFQTKRTALIPQPAQ